MASTDTGRLPSLTASTRTFLINAAAAAATTTTTTITTTTTTITATARPATPTSLVPRHKDQGAKTAAGGGGGARGAADWAEGEGSSGSSSGGAAVVVVSGGAAGGERQRQRLPGVGTYLIDTPKDAGRLLRQRLLSFQELHRGLGKSQDEALPEIPFRLNPRPDLPAPSSIMNQPTSILKADVATSPMPEADEDSNPSPSHTPSPAPSSARTVTFLTEPEVTRVKVRRAENVKPKASRGGVKRNNSRGTDPGPLTSSVTERTRKGGPTKTVRECTKVNLSPFNSHDTGKDPPSHHHVTGRLSEYPDTARTPWALNSSRTKSSSLSDLTDLGSLFTLLDKESNTRTPRALGSRADNVGAKNFFPYKKSKSLLDLMKAPDEDFCDLSSYHKRQRIAHLAFRRDSSARRSLRLSTEDADKEWMAMLNSKVVDNADYDKFASRRKPVTPSSKKTPGRSYQPRSGVDFKISQPSSGKVFPVFFNDGLPVRKFGHASHRRKVGKSKT